MNHAHPTTSLGFAEGRFPVGTHVCQVVTGDKEREDALVAFLMSGLQEGERSACFSDNVSQKTIADFLEANGLSFEKYEQEGLLSVSGTRDVYFPEGKFCAHTMLDTLTAFHEGAVADGCPAARVIGEMDPDIKNIEGGDQLLEYEARVSLLLEKHPVTAVCQYDARKFDGAMLMDVLKVHPMMVVNGTIVRNPFYVSPAEFLASRAAQTG